MSNVPNYPIREASIVTLSLLSWQFAGLSANANPQGGSVSQGGANISINGNTETITTSSANTYINWNSFNIGASDTTTFVEPSSTSVVWNNINSSGGMSQIMGTLNANGYIILQNASGFEVGGSAAINAGGLIMTTAAAHPPSLSSGGAWEFDAPPPTAQILNYGKINISGGGSAFLIAGDIVNESSGQITAEGGKVGLYAGEKVLVSMSPDGRGLSAQATIPQGSVDNEGRLVADGGTVAIEAQTVNQNGVAQANAVQNVNGVIELVAGNDLNIGASSDIEANGDSTAGSASPGGFVVLQSGNTYEDTATSTVNVNGQNGGQGGIVEVLGSGSVQSSINGAFATLNNPSYITLSGNPTDTTSDPANPNFNVADLSNYGQVDLHALDTIELSTYWMLNDLGTPGTLTLSAGNNILVDFGAGIDSSLNPADSSTDPANYWNINLNAGTSFVPSAGQPTPAGGTDGITIDGSLNMANGNVALTAANSIEVGGSLGSIDSLSPSSLSLTAGNSIIVDSGASIAVGNGWSINAVAGAGFDSTTAQSKPAANTDGVYLYDNAFIQSQDSDINVWAANEILLSVNPEPNDSKVVGGIRTFNGGNISVDAVYGNVNTGINPLGYNYSSKLPYYVPYTDLNQSLGGISTAAGGNVDITAGGNVYSFLPASGSVNTASDGGTGAFGPEAGNVTITAGGSVYGHYVLANGIGSITAGQDVGSANGQAFALSLVAGGWTVNAPNGSIYLQEVRNPNGDFNEASGNKNSPAYHLFDYAPNAYVDLNADGVVLTDSGVPRLTVGGTTEAIPVLYAPILDINAGAGGVTLEGNVTLFPSQYQNLDINIVDGGNFTAPAPVPGTSPFYLYMSDSSATQWKSITSFSLTDHGSTLIGLNDPNPVQIDVAGDMVNLDLFTSRATDINVGGDMINCGFSGQNLHKSDTTSINVKGQIYNQSAYTYVNGINIPAIPAIDLPPGYASSWQSIFSLALDPNVMATLEVPANIPPSQWFSYVTTSAAFGPFKGSTQNGQYLGLNPGFVYNPTTGVLGYGGAMTQAIESILNGPITVLQFGSDGLPLTYTSNGKTYFQTTTISWASPSVVATLFANSQIDPDPAGNSQIGYRLGGPGQFDINAGSISLGNSFGILSCGAQDPQGGFNRYANLASFTQEGATVNVDVSGDLTMATSTIAALGGGDVNVTSTGGSMDLGTTDPVNVQVSELGRDVGYGVFTSGGGDVNVIASGDVNIDGSRIATYNGGNIFVESLTGNVDVGSGGDTFTGVQVDYVNAAGQGASYKEDVYGSGIVANTLVPPPKGAPFPTGVAAQPGNITVTTPQGNIVASLGGITQEALDGNIAAGPTINLSAGTMPFGQPGDPDYSPGYAGNIDLGLSGVIGGTVNAMANGNITGLIISRQNSNINAAQNFSGSVLAGGAADVSGGGSVSGTIIGVGGASVSGASVSADVLSQNANVNGAGSTSTLGSSAAATSTSASAANQSSADNKDLASTDQGLDDNKKKKNQPLMQRVKRVTVILPKT